MVQAPARPMQSTQQDFSDFDQQTRRDDGASVCAFDDIEEACDLVPGTLSRNFEHETAGFDLQHVTPLLIGQVTHKLGFFFRTFSQFFVTDVFDGKSLLEALAPHELTLALEGVDELAEQGCGLLVRAVLSHSAQEVQGSKQEIKKLNQWQGEEFLDINLEAHHIRATVYLTDYLNSTSHSTT